MTTEEAADLLNVSYSGLKKAGHRPDPAALDVLTFWSRHGGFRDGELSRDMARP
jgi:hypothetical protein